MERAGTVLAAVVAAAALAGAGDGFAAEGSPAPQQPLTDRRPTVQSAIATPAQDLNLKKTPIPEVLQKAAANPYDVAGLGDCAAIAAEIASLDQALGADRDAPPAPEGGKGPTVGAVLKTGVEAIIPYRGVVRMVSGANAHEKTLADAVQVGFARRGFLKGRAVEMNCPAPASPAGYIQKPELASAPVDVAPAPDIPAAPLYTLEAPTAASEQAALGAPSPNR